MLFSTRLLYNECQWLLKIAKNSNYNFFKHRAVMHNFAPIFFWNLDFIERIMKEFRNDDYAVYLSSFFLFSISSVKGNKKHLGL